MILTPTVLILGAGASHPYGYPLGAGLVDQIVEMTEPRGPMRRLIRGRPIIQELRDRLKGSDVSSIDDFLESNSQFVDIGKQLIAAALTVFGPKETDDPPKPELDWYRYLWKSLHEGAATLEGFRKNQLKVVTYNYDQSLEQYLTRVLGKLYGRNPSDAERVVREAVPVIHLHGTLRTLGDDYSGTTAEGDTLISWPTLQEVSGDMSVVHEDRMSEAYQKASEWLLAAQSVHVLGFGYHPTNLRRLDLRSKFKQGTWRFFGGSALGLERAEQRRVELALGYGKVYDVDCKLYLRRHALLE